MLSLTCFYFFSLSFPSVHFPGWWFDACGPSNLNGMFYTAGQNHGKLNGIKWHYFKGPSYSLRSTTMMIRPLDFWKRCARMGNLQRNLGVLSDEKPFGGFRNEQHCLPSISKRLCDGAKVLDYGAFWFQKCPRGSLCSSELYPEKTTHCHALEREEAARFATLQSAPGFYFEPIARWW